MRLAAGFLVALTMAAWAGGSIPAGTRWRKRLIWAVFASSTATVATVALWRPWPV